MIAVSSSTETQGLASVPSVGSPTDRAYRRSADAEELGRPALNISCPSCSTRYSVEDNRISPSGVTIKCPKCTHSFVVKRDGEITSEGPVPLPAAPGSAGGAVPLPGGAGGAGGAGNDQSALFPPGSLGDDLGGPPPSQSPQGQRIAQSGVLNFIDDTAQRAGVESGGLGYSSELRVRRTNGSVEGPYGIQRIITMMRNGDLAGNEQISEDGRNWQPMHSKPELSQVLDQLSQPNSNFGAFGDLGELPNDLPGLPSRGAGPTPTDLPGLPASRADTVGMAEEPTSPEGLITSVADDTANPMGGALGSPAGIGADMGGVASASPEPRGNIDPSLLEVGEIPQLP